MSILQVYQHNFIHYMQGVVNFDLDRTTSAPARCYSASKFFDGSYCTISISKEHTFVDVLVCLRPSSGLCVLQSVVSSMWVNRVSCLT